LARKLKKKIGIGQVYIYTYVSKNCYPKKTKKQAEKSKEEEQRKITAPCLVLIISHCKFQLKTLHVLKSNQRDRAQNRAGDIPPYPTHFY